MSWLSDYMDYVSDANTSSLFKRWAGVFTVSAAIQRRCWSLSFGEVVYPNLYILFIGPSAAGKGVALGPIDAILSELDNQHIAPSSLTGAGLADELEESLVTFIDHNGIPHQYNALTVISREFGVFLPAYDGAMLASLTDVWDNKGYSERRRGRGKRLQIDKAIINMIGGATPAYLNNTLPENAWEEGFMSRCVVVYASAMPPVPFQEEKTAGKNLSSIANKLRNLVNRSGRLKWETDAIEFFNRWYMGGRRPVPTHPRLTTYAERRHHQLMKLSMIHAVADGASTIKADYVKQSLDLLIETEGYMPDVFKAMKSGGDQQAIKELWHFMFTIYAKTDKPIHRTKLIKFLAERVPAHSVERLLYVVEKAGLIQPAPGGTFIPVKPEV